MSTSSSGIMQAGQRLGRLNPARVALALTAAASIAMAAGLPAILRVPVVLGFCLAAPGLGTVGHLKLRRPSMEAALVLGVSLSTLIIGSYLLLKVGLWSDGWMLLVVALPAVIGGGLAELRASRLPA